MHQGITMEQDEIIIDDSYDVIFETVLNNLNYIFFKNKYWIPNVLIAMTYSFDKYINDHLSHSK